MADIFELFKKIAKKEESTTSPITHLIVGLGNPGDTYSNTRHNAGFLCVDAVARKCGAQIDRLKFHALCGEAQFGTHRVLLLKPQTMMNLSGTAVGEAAAFYKIATENVIVISDDITQSVGRIRVRRQGSAGGHNGLKDIIAHLGSEKFPRVRLGVGEKPCPDYDLAAWVLSEFTKREQSALFGTFDCVWEGLNRILDGKIDDAMQLCNSYASQEE